MFGLVGRIGAEGLDGAGGGGGGDEVLTLTLGLGIEGRVGAAGDEALMLFLLI